MKKGAIHCRGSSSSSSILALRLTAFYALFGALWIALSDSLLAALAPDPADLTYLQTYKGWFFILITALLVYALSRRALGIQGTLLARLRDGENRYRALFKANPHPMWVYDLETLRFLAVNAAAVKHYGYSREEFLGMTIKDIRPPEDVPALMEKLTEVRDEGLDRAGIWRHRLKDGRLIEVEIRAHALDFGGRHAEVVLAHDVTEQRRTQEAILKLNTELEERVEERTAQLEAVNRELEAFSYSVSHDLKAPLRGIDGYSRLLEEDYREQLDEEGRFFLSNIRQGTAQMYTLIEDLLAYSRMERRPLQSASLDLGPLVRTIVDEYAQEMVALGVVLRMEIPEMRVCADRDGLGIVLRNLLDNALKFSRGACPPTIEIGARQEGEKALVWVRDNGKGFDMKFHDRLYEMFSRLDRVEEYPGTGVGLALVRKAMQRMGGRVWAESAPDKGAVFFLELPR